jgi:hypothetical protein
LPEFSEHAKSPWQPFLAMSPELSKQEAMPKQAPSPTAPVLP